MVSCHGTIATACQSWLPVLFCLSLCFPTPVVTAWVHRGVPLTRRVNVVPTLAFAPTLPRRTCSWATRQRAKKDDISEESWEDDFSSDATDDIDFDDDEIDLEIDLDEEDEEDEESIMEAPPSPTMKRLPLPQRSSPVMSNKDETDETDVALDNLNEPPEDDLALLDATTAADQLEDADILQQRALIDAAIDASAQRDRDESFDALDFFQSDAFTPAMAASLEDTPFFQRVQQMAQGLELTEEDCREEDVTDDTLDEAVANVPDLMTDDPYPRHTSDEINFLQQTNGLTDDDMEALDDTYKTVAAAVAREPWDKVMVRGEAGLENLSNATLAELDDCLGEIGGSAYNVTKWLLYDLDFNVSNLILAAVQHNRDAPILLAHWYPQLVTYARYQHARDRNFDFTWDDVQGADLSELQRYYAGFGYDEIPHKAPSETGIISLEDLDEEEIKMAAFENWMTDVYNPEVDRKDFDDDTLRDEDNVFSDFYEDPQHPDLPTLEDAAEDLDQWHADLQASDGDADHADATAYRDMMGQRFDYTVVHDDDFARDFRGHLIIACTGDDADLEICQALTARFDREFGKQVFVETRVMALAREEDNVFEVWLESYEVDLLHSKKRATSSAKGWTGPADVDDAQIDYLTERVRFLISDDARYSYRLEMDLAEQ